MVFKQNENDEATEYLQAIELRDLEITRLTDRIKDIERNMEEITNLKLNKHSQSLLEQEKNKFDLYKINFNLKLKSLEFDNNRLREEVAKFNIQNSMLLEQNRSCGDLNEKFSNDIRILKEQMHSFNSSQKLNEIPENNYSQTNKLNQLRSSSHPHNMIGYYKSNGSQNGKPLFRGVCNGIYYWNGNNNITYLTQIQKEQNIIYI